MQKAPLQMLDYVLNIPLTPLNCQSTNFPNYNGGRGVGGGGLERERGIIKNLTTIIQIKRFIKVGSTDSFESWLLATKLVS